PGPPARLARVPVGEGTPDGGHPYREPVTDGGGDAADDALDEAAARQQRRGEGKGREDDRAPAAGERDVKHPAVFRLRGGWRRWAAGWHLGRSGFGSRRRLSNLGSGGWLLGTGSRGRLTGVGLGSKLLARRIWMLT